MSEVAPNTITPTPAIVPAVEPVVTPPVATVTPAVEAAKVEPVVTPAPVTPNEVVLKLPDGSLLKPESIDQISAYAKEKGFNQEQTQALINRESETLSAFASAQKEQFEATKETWKTEAMADKEIGGQNFTKSVELAKRALDRFGEGGLGELLDQTGFGNHPAVLKAFARIGQAMSEASIDKPNGFTPAAKKSASEMLYGSTKS